MKIRVAFAWISLFTFPLLVSAQTPVPIGTRMPEIEFGQIINYKTGKAKISDFRGKLLIIDVWSKACSSCIAGFPKLEKLQNEYKDKIQVLLLTRDKMPDFEYIKSRAKNIQVSTLPFVIGDTVIGKLFPHKAVPLHIWIDSSGIVRVVSTGGFNTNSQTLAKYFAGQPLEMISWENEIQDLDMSESLLTEGGGRHLKGLLSYSVWLKSINYRRRGWFDYSRDKVSSKITGMKFINCDLEMFFTKAFDNPRIEMSFPGAERYRYPGNNDTAKNDYIKNYTFCYEQKVPEGLCDSVSAMKELLKKDLARYFGLQGKVSKQMLPCYDLVATGKLDAIRTKNTKQNPHVSRDFDGLQHTIRNWSISHLISILERRVSQIDKSESEITIVNRTGYKENIDIELNLDVHSIDEINKLLSRYNLKVVPSFVETEVVVVTKVQEKPQDHLISRNNL